MIGFSDRFNFQPIIGWELYQVTIDKYHVMFWFENERALLNVADRFSFKSSNEAINYTYEIYGTNKFMNVDSILRIRIKNIQIVNKDQLDIVFENRDILSIYDNPEFRSWWFLGGRQYDPPKQATKWSFSLGDYDIEDMTDAELEERRR